MSEYIRTNKFDPNECPNIFVQTKLTRMNVRINIRAQYIRIFEYSNIFVTLCTGQWTHIKYLHLHLCLSILYFHLTFPSYIAILHFYLIFTSFLTFASASLASTGRCHTDVSEWLDLISIFDFNAFALQKLKEIS